MKKYEVRTVTVETRNNEPFKTFMAKVDQDTQLVGAFDTEAEARACYDSVPSGATETSDHGMPLYVHECKLIEINEYDEDGDWVEGGDWLCYDFPKVAAQATEASTRSRIFFCDMDSRGFEQNDQIRSENLACEIFEDELYGIDDFYADRADIQLEPLAEYGRGWYTYTNDDKQQRYVYVDRIEKPDPEYPGEWIINGDRWKEYSHEFTAAELAEIGGKTVQSVYNLAHKLGRLPTPDELKAVRRGAPRKYH